MRRILTVISLLGVGMIMLSGASRPTIQDDTFVRPFNVVVEPVGSLHKGTSVSLNLTYQVNLRYRRFAGSTGSYSAIFINPRDWEDTINITTFPVTYDSTFSYTGTFQLTLPDADTNFCVIRVQCGSLYERRPYYFISSGDSIAFLKRFMMPLPANPQVVWGIPGDLHTHPDRDTLTDAQLATKYEIQLDLRDRDLFSYAEKILGPIPDSCKSDVCDACYILNVTLGDIYKLHDAGVDLEFTTPPPWDRRYDAPIDSVLKNEP